VTCPQFYEHNPVGGACFSLPFDGARTKPAHL